MHSICTRLPLAALASAIVLSVSGCATSNQAQLNTNANIKASYRFAQDSIKKTEVQPQEVNSAVRKAIADNTAYAFRTWMATDIRRFAGVYINPPMGADMTVVYANGDIFNHAGGGTFLNTKHQSNTQFRLHIAQPSANAVTVDVDANVLQVNSTSPIGTAYKQLAATEVLVSDLQKTLSDPAKIFVRRYTQVEGEINATFNPDSIYANFLRKLGRYDGRDLPKINDIEKRAAYNFQVGREKVALLLNVVPYRNGSKVSYVINVPYSLLGNGDVTVSQKNLDEARAQIAKIVND